MSDEANQAFERDVPKALRDDAMQMMAEATGGWTGHADVTILDHDRIDAINCRASGIIRIGDREFTFQMADGNRNGTELLAWESDRPFEYHQPTRWALQPNADIVSKAIADGKGPFLIAKWDAMLKRQEIASIPGKYGYDRTFAPGIVTERHWREAAERRQFVIVEEDEAKQTRERLRTATVAWNAAA